MSEPRLELPAPTAAPLFFALGVTLLGSGLVTHWLVSALGGALIVTGAIGWWRELFPQEQVEEVALPALEQRPPPVVPPPPRAPRPIAAGSEHRLRVPLSAPPISAGVAGGIAGAVAMAAVAMTYGLIAQGSLWYPINLLAAGALPSLARASDAELRAFQPVALLVGTLVHGASSLIVGVLYAMLLPMLPRRHMLWGGFIAPLLWTGAVWAVLGVVDPTLDARIDWRWFIASQLAFGLTAGWFVARAEPVPTAQTRPLGPGQLS